MTKKAEAKGWAWQMFAGHKAAPVTHHFQVCFEDGKMISVAPPTTCPSAECWCGGPEADALYREQGRRNAEHKKENA